MFDQLDVHKRGFIGKEELDLMLRRFGVADGQQRQEQVTTLLQQMDDGSGTVSLQRFNAAASAMGLAKKIDDRNGETPANIDDLYSAIALLTVEKAELEEKIRIQNEAAEIEARRVKMEADAYIQEEKTMATTIANLRREIDFLIASKMATDAGIKDNRMLILSPTVRRSNKNLFEEAVRHDSEEFQAMHTLKQSNAELEAELLSIRSTHMAELDAKEMEIETLKKDLVDCSDHNKGLANEVAVLHEIRTATGDRVIDLIDKAAAEKARALFASEKDELALKNEEISILTEQLKYVVLQLASEKEENRQAIAAIAKERDHIIMDLRHMENQYDELGKSTEESWQRREKEKQELEALFEEELVFMKEKLKAYEAHVSKLHAFSRAILMELAQKFDLDLLDSDDSPFVKDHTPVEADISVYQAKYRLCRERIDVVVHKAESLEGQATNIQDEYEHRIKMISIQTASQLNALRDEHESTLSDHDQLLRLSQQENKSLREQLKHAILDKESLENALSELQARPRLLTPKTSKRLKHENSIDSPTPRRRMSRKDSMTDIFTLIDNKDMTVAELRKELEELEKVYDEDVAALRDELEEMLEEMAKLKADLAVANEQCEELEFYRQATAELREQNAELNTMMTNHRDRNSLHSEFFDVRQLPYSEDPPMALDLQQKSTQELERPIQEQVDIFVEHVRSRLSYQLSIILEAKVATAKSAAIIQQYAQVTEVLTRQNQMLQTALKAARSFQEKQEELSRNQLDSMHKRFGTLLKERKAELRKMQTAVKRLHTHVVCVDSSEPDADV